jgi:alpha-tubulin suppressor-like RCC1 family protein
VFTALVSALETTCGLTAEGDAFCWGFNPSGEVGVDPPDGSTQYPEPVLVSGGHHYRSLSGEANTHCGMTTEGEVYCWGEGRSGELGSGSRNSSVPLLVPAP